MDISKKAIEVKNRINNQLPWAVIGDVAAALDGDQFGADGGGLTSQVGRQVGAGAVGEHVRVFEQQQVLAGAVLEQRALDCERFAVGHPPQPADAERIVHGSAEPQSSVDQSFVSRISLTRRRKLAA